MKHLLAFLLWASAWAWFYWPSLTGLVSVWRTGQTHGWLILLLAAGLGAERWRRCPGRGCDPAPPAGYICFGLSLVLALLGRAGGMDSMVMWSMWLSLVSLVLLLCGVHSLWSQALPILVLLFCLPVPMPLRLEAGRVSAELSANLAARLLHVSGTPAFQAGSTLDLGFMNMNVAQVCDGFGLVPPALLAALLAGAWIARSFGARLILAACVPVLAVLANGLRLGVAGYLARNTSLVAAQSFFHEVSGYAAFGLVLAAVLGLALILRVSLGRGGAGDLDRFGGEGRICPLSPPLNRDCVLHVVTAAVVLALCVPVFPHILKVRDQIAREEFASFPAKLGKWRQDNATLEPEGTWAGDDVLSRAYLSGDRRDRATLRIAYRRVQRPPYRLREGKEPPAGEGWTLIRQEVLPPGEGEDRGFPVWSGVFQQEGERVLVYVWTQGRGRTQAVDWRNSLALAWDTLFTRRADGALLRMELPLRPRMAVPDGERILNGFCREFKDVLPAYIPEP